MKFLNHAGWHDLEGFGMEGKTHTEKGLNWLEAGIPETEGLPSQKSVKFPVVVKQETASTALTCLAATLECEHSGATFGQQRWAGVWTQAGLRCSMSMFTELVLVQVYIKNQLMMHLYRFFLKLLMAVGVYSMHGCFLYIDISLYKHKHV